MINATEGLEIGPFCLNVFFFCLLGVWWMTIDTITSPQPSQFCLPGLKSRKFRSSFSRSYLNKITLTIEKQFAWQGETDDPDVSR